MVKKSFPNLFFRFLIIILIVTACTPQPSPDIKVAEPTQTSQGIPEDTATPSVTPTQTNTATPVPTPTPWPTQAITLETVGSLKRITQWGRGMPIKVEKLGDPEQGYLVLTPLGLYRYADISLEPTLFIPDVDGFIVDPQRERLAVSKKNGDVEIWSLQEQASVEVRITHVFPEDVLQLVREHKVYPFTVSGMAFSPDGTQMAIGYLDSRIELWRIGETAPYATIQHDALALWDADPTLLHALSFSPDGSTLVAFKAGFNANRLTFWNLPDASMISVSDAGRYARFPEALYLPDGRTLLVPFRQDSYVRFSLWDVQTGQLQNQFETGLSYIENMELSPDGRQLVLYGADTQGTNYRQERALPDGALIETQELEELPEAAATEQLERLLRGQHHYRFTWNKGDNVVSARLVNEQRTPLSILGEDYLVTLPDGSIRDIPQSEATNAYYDPQGNFTAWCEPGQIVIEEISGERTQTASPVNGACMGVVISNQKHYAAVWGEDDLPYVINLVTGEYNKTSFELRWNGTKMLTATFTSDEKFLITSKTAIVTLWKLEPFHRVADSHKALSYMGNNLDISLSEDNSMGISLNANRGTTSDRSSQLIIWRIEDMFPLHRINPPQPEPDFGKPMFNAFALSSDGTFFVSGDDLGWVRFWSTTSGEELASYELHENVLDLSITPDGSGLIVVLVDGTVELWGVP